MFIIGLTGNIGTGKSTLMRMLAELGAQIIDADQIAHEVQKPGAPAFPQVLGAFGPDILGPDGSIDRRKLGEIVFQRPERLQQLEAIVHPHVVERIVELLRQPTSQVIVIEAIKLIEVGLGKLCNEIWVVTTTRELQLERLCASRGLTAAAALARIESQPPQADKVRLASVVFDNTRSLADLRRQVEGEWARVQPPLPSQP